MSARWIAVILLSLVASCSSSNENPGGGNACTPGATHGCTCSGGPASGVQACKPDGSGYGPCNCADSGLGGGGSAGLSSGGGGSGGLGSGGMGSGGAAGGGQGGTGLVAGGTGGVAGCTGTCTEVAACCLPLYSNGPSALADAIIQSPGACACAGCENLCTVKPTQAEDVLPCLQCLKGDAGTLGAVNAECQTQDSCKEYLACLAACNI